MRIGCSAAEFFSLRGLGHPQGFGQSFFDHAALAGFHAGHVVPHLLIEAEDLALGLLDTRDRLPKKAGFPNHYN